MPGMMTKAQALGLAAAAGAAGTAIAVQRRHLRGIARDPHYAELTRALEGAPVEVHSADGTRLHAEVFDPQRDVSSQAGSPVTFVLIHGWTEQLTLWGPVIRILTGQGMRVVAYDLRGHGRSGPASGEDYALERFGEDVEAVLEALTPIDQRAVVVGHSLGAMSIAAWAEHHDVGRRARATALVNTGFGDLLAGHVLFGELAARFNSQRAGRMLMGSRAPLPAVSAPLAQTVIRHVAFGPSADAAEVAFFERMLLDCAPGVRAACGAAMSDMDLQHAVACITVPTLVVAGDRDRLTPPAHARRIAEALPQLAGLCELVETGHMSLLERPEQLSGLLLKLVNEHPDPSTRQRAPRQAAGYRLGA